MVGDRRPHKKGPTNPSTTVIRVLDRYRYLACFLAGQFIAVPAYSYVGKALNDEAGGPTAAGVVTGLGIGILAALWLEQHLRRR